jgi:hypothetical protein
MKKWIQKNNRLNVLVFNENNISHQYLSNTNADFYMLYLDNSYYMDRPKNFYGLFNKTIPINIDCIIVSDPKRFHVSVDIKNKFYGNPLIICYHENGIMNNGDINIFDNESYIEYAKENKYTNIIFIEKCVDKEYFKKDIKNISNKLLCFDQTPLAIKNLINEKSINTMPPICGQYRRDLYNENSAFLNVKDYIGFDVLEAMSCEMPIITSQKSLQTNEGLIQHGINGYIYKDISDIEKFPEIDIELRNYMGINARNKILNMSKSVFIDTWNNLFLSIKGA